MNNIRLFIISSSLVLAAWLGASYLTEVRISPNQKKAASSTQEPPTASENASEEKIKTPLPVAHFN